MPSLKLEVILLCVLIKSSRFPIVVSSFTVIEPASEPSELYKLMVLCAADIELDMPNSASLVASVASTVIVSFFESALEVTYLPDKVSVKFKTSARFEVPPFITAFSIVILCVSESQDASIPTFFNLSIKVFMLSV